MSFEFYNGREENATMYCRVVRPDTLDTPERIAYYDGYAARVIDDAERLIDSLREYRQQLAARYAALETMPYKRRLQIKRWKTWNDSPVKYEITIIREYEDGTKQDELREHYSGKERRDALKRFEALKKQYPGIPAEMDIAKKAWEK